MNTYHAILWVLPLSFLTSFITPFINHILNKKFEFPKLEDMPLQMRRERVLKTMSFISGFFEIFLYAFSILLNIHVFIAFWLGVKTALRWDVEKKERQNVTGRTIQGEESHEQIIKFHYLRFLLGNSLNISISYLIASFIKGEWILL